MTNRTALINELESLLIECFNTIANLTTYQQIKENDARVTFFKHLVNVIDSTIVSLLVAHKYLGDENWWKEIQKEYNLSARRIPFVREFAYYDQVVTNSFFHLMFSSFESSIRLIVKRYDSNLYNSQRDFNPLSKGLISKLKLGNKGLRQVERGLGISENNIKKDICGSVQRVSKKALVTNHGMLFCNIQLLPYPTLFHFLIKLL
jgi:hypothetical protein